MPREFLQRRSSIALAAAITLLTAGAAQAEPVGPIALSSPPTPTASIPGPAAERAPACTVDVSKARFDKPLAKVARKLATHRPVKIVALGSSSTFGAGASTSAGSYPSRLAAELAARLPGQDIIMVNRGVNGDEAKDMLARLERDVLAEGPDLVLWQVGTNSLLRDKAVLPHATLLHEGLARLKATGADIVLIDPQYAPKVLAKPNHEGMVSLVATAAKAEHVCLFHRFELMRHWHQVERLPFETFVSEDGLHMNDWSYACVAKWLGAAIAEAATRPVATAAAPQTAR
jgi:lysophospholipase L1-like esterase